jgi:hypothetical protein
VFPTNKEVIVPVNCSCEGQYYSSNTMYIVTSGAGGTYFSIASNIYQGLSTCNALRSVNQYGDYNFHPGLELHVPLRCACPTRNQTADGTSYLLTYLVNLGDHVSDIAERFNLKV